jgi:hypothetical protein
VGDPGDRAVDAFLIQNFCFFLHTYSRGTAHPANKKPNRLLCDWVLGFWLSDLMISSPCQPHMGWLKG